MTIIYELRRTEVDLAETEQWRSSFESSIRNIVRSLWNGVYDYYQAYEVLDMAITNGFTRAWYDGADAAGITPAELSPEERAEMHRAILEQRQYIDGFLTAIENGSKANGGKLRPLFYRAGLWTKRYDDIRNRALAMAHTDPKLRWHKSAKDSCRSCIALAGKVKRASFWRAHVMPQSPKLECVHSANGVPVCRCSLVPTDDPCTPGPLPLVLVEGAFGEGGPGSGHHKHRGIPGKHGGSAPSGTIDPHGLSWVQKMERIATERGSGTMVIPEDWHAWTQIQSGVGASGQMGRCYYNAMQQNQEHGDQVAVGLMFIDTDIERIEQFDDERYFGLGGVGTPHAWNVRDGKVVDTTMGSRGMKGTVYIGETVPQATIDGFVGDRLVQADDAKLHNYVGRLLDKTQPQVDSGRLRRTWDEWNERKASRKVGEADGLEEGGPGSGHHGHAGIPGYHGGSRASGVVIFKSQPTSAEPGGLDKHIQAYASKHSEEWAGTLTRFEEKIASGYLRSNYGAINDCLRNRKTCNELMGHVAPGTHHGYGERVYRHRDTLYEAINRSRVPEDTVVYRGMKTHRLQQMKKGDYYQDNGFVSTSLNSGMAEGWKEAVAEIRVPKGAKGAYAQRITEFPHEAELLLQAGSQFKFVGMKTINVRRKVWAKGEQSFVDVERECAIFELVGQGDPLIEQHGPVYQEAERETRAATDRFQWEEGDFFAISADDIVPIGYDGDELEEK